MLRQSKENFAQLFSGTVACSFMPHWACHYYRIETGSSFAVADWAFSFADSFLFLLIYAILITAAMLSIALPSLRKPSFLWRARCI